MSRPLAHLGRLSDQGTRPAALGMLPASPILRSRRRRAVLTCNLRHFCVLEGVKSLDPFEAFRAGGLSVGKMQMRTERPVAPI